MNTKHFFVAVILMIVAYFIGVKFPQYGNALLSKL